MSFMKIITNNGPKSGPVEFFITVLLLGRSVTMYQLARGFKCKITVTVNIFYIQKLGMENRLALYLYKIIGDSVYHIVKVCVKYG